MHCESLPSIRQFLWMYNVDVFFLLFFGVFHRRKCISIIFKWFNSSILYRLCCSFWFYLLFAPCAHGMCVAFLQSFFSLFGSKTYFHIFILFNSRCILSRIKDSFPFLLSPSLCVVVIDE